MRIHCLIVPLAILLLAPSYAQQLDLTKFTPDNWTEVRFAQNEHRFVDAKGDTLSEAYWSFKSDGKVNKNEKWLVFTDKAGLLLRDKPNGAADSSPLQFGTLLYVFKEDGEWLQVGKDRQKAEGWCAKKDLILWSQPLVDPITRIELKAFLVNTLQGTVDERKSSIEGELKQKYEVFDGPGPEAKKVKANFLYDVLYIFKYDKGDGNGKGERWLVGPYRELGSQFPLLGWVNARKVKVWATRLCLEPNFQPQAMAERKTKNIRARLMPNTAFQEQRTYLGTGNGVGLVDGEENEPAFDGSGRTRMDARLFRYPVFDASKEGDNNCKFLTGVSGVWNPGMSGTLSGFNFKDYLLTQRYYESMREHKDVLDVMFVVEGSADMKEHVQTVKDAIGAVQKKYKGSGITARYGVVYYYNEHSTDAKEPETEYIEQLPLTNDAGSVLNWLDKRIATNKGDPNEARASFRALQRGMDLLEKGRTSILVHICRRPDNYQIDGLFGGKSKIEPADLGAALEFGRSPHYLGYVTAGSGPKLELRQLAFEGLQSVIGEMSTAVSNQLKGTVDLGLDSGGRATAPTITITKKSGVEVARMDRFHFVMKATLFTSPVSDLATTIATDVAECMAQTQRAMEGLSQVVEDKSMLKGQASDFTYFAGEMYKNAGPNGQETLDYMAREKVHVFENAVTFYKVADLQDPLFCYVLFYDGKDLDKEVSSLNKVITALEKGNTAESGEELQAVWRERAEGVMGSKFNDKVQINEVRSKLLGINNMDMVKPFADASILNGLNLNDLKNSKKFDLAHLDKYKNSAIENKRLLEDMKTKGECYRVPGDQERKYYWVPIEYLFE